MENVITSQAKEFFNKINDMNDADGFQFIKNLINTESPTYESDWIDFKGAEQLDDKKPKEIWSKAISGYANSGDGILLWGIDARKDESTNIDCARSLSLVKNPQEFISRLKELQRHSTEPPVKNIEYKDVNNNDEKGFVVCYIPESPFKPYRAEAAGRNYYIRAGDSFQVPSVSLLRTLFYPEFHSFLWPELKVINDNAGNSFIIEGYIHISGVGSAKKVIIAMEVDPPCGNFYKVDNSWDSIKHEAVKNNDQSIAFLCKNPIHPGVILHFFHFNINKHTYSKLPLHIIDPLVFKFIFYSENNKPLFSFVPFYKENINDFETKNGKENTSLLKPEHYDKKLYRIIPNDYKN